MKWFEGGIPNAIQAAKQSNAVFIVFIASDDDKSQEMESSLNSHEVTGLCEQSQCVAVKIMSNSSECRFFSQIYPVVVVPSTFFIGSTGVPLEVIGGVTSTEDFLVKVKNAIEMQKSEIRTQQASDDSISSSVCQEQSGITSSEESRPVAADVQGNDFEEASAEGGRGIASSGSGDDDHAPEKRAKPSEDLNTKVERAKQAMTQKREEKRHKEAEHEKEKELERRSMGQNVQKLRHMQKEMEMKEAKKELKKEKEEEKLARQRVKEQIERDRAERAARFGKEKEERELVREETRKRKILQEQAALQEEHTRRSDTARLQFRNPDGSSITQQFPATATFGDVFSFIVQESGPSVTLSTTFPRHTFSVEDHNRTLQELELVPSAAILVIPGGMSTSGVRRSSSTFGVSSLTSIILAPVMFFWNIIASLLGFSGPSSASTSSNAISHDRPIRASASSGGNRDSGGALKLSSVRSSSQPEGTIHRFHNIQDDEDPDDNSTWNGNSTQQM